MTSASVEKKVATALVVEGVSVEDVVIAVESWVKKVVTGVLVGPGWVGGCRVGVVVFCVLLDEELLGWVGA